jgi:hypothetical protein
MERKDAITLPRAVFIRNQKIIVLKAVFWIALTPVHPKILLSV